MLMDIFVKRTKNVAVSGGATSLAIPFFLWWVVKQRLGLLRFDGE